MKKKKINKKWGSKCSFWHHSADKYSYLEPFGENQAQPKLKGSTVLITIMK